MNNQLVVIDDENSDGIIDVDEVEIVGTQNKYLHHQKIFKRPIIMDTIVIDDSTEQEVTSIKSSPINKQTHYCYDFIFKENQMLSEFIEKCLDLENSLDMLRAINQTLVKIYKRTDEDYKKSPMFTKVLLQSLKRLELKPEFKYSHIKDLCEVLKLHSARRKVPFVTLATNVTQNKMQNEPYKVMKKRKIDINNSDQDNTIIDLNEDEVVLLDDKTVGENSNKENNKVHMKNNDVIIEKEKNNASGRSSNGIQSEMENKTPETENISKTVLENSNGNEHLNELLVPSSNQDKQDTNTNVNEEKIKKIEKLIKKYKKKINQLDMQEVQDDTILSPYIQSQKLKAKIVALYKELCNITGAEANKQRNVRLQVADGHSVEPMRCLEEFINSNIGDNGEPVFPDFLDVKNCVEKANAKCKLGWTAGQISKEAKALFTQYGTALQKWRQQREWKYLMSYIKEETDIDPADSDSDLLASLEENKHIAMKNEKDLLERYANIESKSKGDPELRLELSGLNSSDECSESEEITADAIPVASEQNEDKTKPKLVNDIHKDSKINVSNVNSSITSPSLQLKSPDIQDKASIMSLQELKIHPVAEKRKIINTLHDHNYDHKVLESNIIKTEPNNKYECHVEPVDTDNLIHRDYIKDGTLPEIKKEHTVAEDNSNNVNRVIIKTEQEDIPAMLKQLGSSFTATIIDIEDPFLVIEISSDSDSEDD